MSELYLLRHAKAAPQHDGGDRGRPLEQRGRRAAESVAAWIADHKISPELVLSSPAIRTRQTLDIVSPAFARPPEIRIEDNLYLATARQLLTRLRQLSSGVVSVMLVGHNPGFHELANYLSDVASGPLSARIAAGFPTAALARYETDVDWSALDRRLARLVAFLVPTELIRGTD